MRGGTDRIEHQPCAGVGPIRIRWGGRALALLLTASGALANPISHASPEQLAIWLRQYPRADANGDGTLTLDEAEAYRSKLGRERPPSEYAFATMSDGVKIALAVGFPAGSDPREPSRRWPAIFTTCGYALASQPWDPGDYDHRYVTVTASIRGTGASGGALSPWKPRSWRDGYEIIENWIVKQPWSNGRVGIRGHSWTGLMGFLIAGTAPPSLKAVCLSGLIEDFYRGIAWPGGVRNFGFPIMWVNNDYLLDGPFGSGVAACKARGLDDAAYQAIVASRPERDLSEDQLWLMLHEPLDGPRWQQRSLAAQAPKIRAPILIGHTWQDQETGPSGCNLWRLLPSDIPKRLVLSNGDHGVHSLSKEEKLAWFDHHLLDAPHPDIGDARHRVKCYFETAKIDEGRPSVAGPFLARDDFPFPDTRWTPFYLRSDRRLATEPPAREEPPDSYEVTFHNSGSAGERIGYSLAFPAPAAICGPAVLTLWVKLANLDTDIFALLTVTGSDGKTYGLQRGLLRASHRAIDERRSTYATVDGRRVLIRPHHPHDRPEPVPPHAPCELEIEIPAFGHLFRAGQTITLTITRPPLADPIGVTRSGVASYRYDSYPPAGTVTILHDAAHPSRLLLPLLPSLPPAPPAPVPLARQVGLQEVK